jgi:signal transduction histidine kinase
VNALGRGGAEAPGDANAPQPERLDLSASLREAAARAVRLAPGAVALVFAHGPLDNRDAASPSLRAAAGFSSTEEARATASTFEKLARRTTREGRGSSGAGDPALAHGGSVLAMPLGVDERSHGALIVASPAALPPAAREALLAIVSSVGLRLDHAHLAATLERWRSQALETAEAAEDKNDEILKLSEALFAQDIEILRSNEKLGQVEKLKNDFIEKMSRELRTPLNSIIEAIISVLAGENEAISDASKQSLRSALDEGTAFLRTLQNILDLWRLKQGELPVEIQEVSFPEVVDEALFSIQDTLQGKSIEIEKQLQDPFPKLRTDLAKVNLVLFLLLDNAAKFTPAGRITIRARVEGEELVCEVIDSGIGICPDDQEMIFDEFYQVDELSSTRYRGAGLGLTLARDLLRLLDGDVSVRSDAGHGATFGFRIPVQPA